MEIGQGSKRTEGAAVCDVEGNSSRCRLVHLKLHGKPFFRKLGGESHDCNHCSRWKENLNSNNCICRMNAGTRKAASLGYIHKVGV
jgi:hypothetical protein